MNPAIYAPVAAVVAVLALYLLAVRPLTVHPLGQHHGGRKDPAKVVERALQASAAEVRAAWDHIEDQADKYAAHYAQLAERDTAHVLTVWQQPVQVNLTQAVQRAEARAQAALTRPERERREAETGRPWADDTGVFAKITVGE